MEKTIVSESGNVAGKLASLGKKRKAIRRKFTAEEKGLKRGVGKIATVAKKAEIGLQLKAGKSAVVGRKNRGIGLRLAVTVADLRVLVKERENIRHKLTAAEKKLSLNANHLAAAIKEKEAARKKLALIAKEKEIIRRRLAVRAKQLATIAEQKEKSERRYRILFESSADAIMMQTKDTFFDCNPATLKMFGFTSRKEFIGKRPDQISPPTQADGRDSRAVADEKIAAAFKEGNVTFDWINRRADGTDFDTNVLLTRVELLGRAVLQATIRDITKEQELVRAKDEFISLASHQLKTPITVMSWNLETLLEGDHGPLSKEQRDALEVVYGSSKKMAELVAGFLDVTKIESGGFVSEKGDVDLPQIADAVQGELANQISAKKINVIKKYGSDVPHLDIGTKTATVIFQNLLTNAVKYTQENGTVEVRVEKSRRGGVSISVKDTGCGIPENAKSKIFTKLFRADNAIKKEPSGTGLGLYLLKSLVDKLGGKVWFESQEGSGSTFYVDLK